MFISCSDDETIKIWGVKNKIKLELVTSSLANNTKDKVKKIDVRHEDQREDNAEVPNRVRRSRGSTDSRNAPHSGGSENSESDDDSSSSSLPSYQATSSQMEDSSYYSRSQSNSSESSESMESAEDYSSESESR